MKIVFLVLVPMSCLTLTTLRSERNYTSNKNKYLKVAGPTKSLPGLPTDSRISFKSSVISSSNYYGSKRIADLVDSGLKYISCDDKGAEVASATPINISTFNDWEYLQKKYKLDSNELHNLKARAKNNCTGKVMVSVGHYVDSNAKCSIYNNLVDNQSAYVIPKSIIRGSSLSSKGILKNIASKSIADSNKTITNDFAIFKTDTVSGGYIFPICEKRICTSSHDMILPQITMDSGAQSNLTLLDKVSSSKCQMLKEKKEREIYTSSLVEHTCDAMPGSSGAPILNLSCGSPCIQGLHSSGLFSKNNIYKPVDKNFGLSLDGDLFRDKMSDFIIKNCSD